VSYYTLSYRSLDNSNTPSRDEAMEDLPIIEAHSAVDNDVSQEADVPVPTEDNALCYTPSDTSSNNGDRSEADEVELKSISSSSGPTSGDDADAQEADTPVVQRRRGPGRPRKPKPPRRSVGRPRGSICKPPQPSRTRPLGKPKGKVTFLRCTGGHIRKKATMKAESCFALQTLLFSRIKKIIIYILSLHQKEGYCILLIMFFSFISDVPHSASTRTLIVFSTKLFKERCCANDLHLFGRNLSSTANFIYLYRTVERHQVLSWMAALRKVFQMTIPFGAKCHISSLLSIFCGIS
jgi:hypothetical protein